MCYSSTVCEVDSSQLCRGVGLWLRVCDVEVFKLFVPVSRAASTAAATGLLSLELMGKTFLPHQIIWSKPA